MEISLEPGNHSAVWKLIMKGVNDMLDEHEGKELQKTIREKKEKFKADALGFCKRFWKEERELSQFGFTEYNKDIIDTIMELLGNDEEGRDEYEREAMWFYDGYQSATEADFYNDFEEETDVNELNEMLDRRLGFLQEIVELSVRGDQHEKRVELEEKKLALYRKALLKEETKRKMVARRKTIKGSILLICKELKNEKLGRRYGKQGLRFYEDLWTAQYDEMSIAAMKKFIREVKDLASSVGDFDRVKLYQDSLQKLIDTGDKPGNTLGQKARDDDDDGGDDDDDDGDDDEEEVIDNGDEDEDLEQSAEGTPEASEQGLSLQLHEFQLNEQQDLAEEDLDKTRIGERMVANQGTQWDLNLGAVHFMFPPDAVSEATPIVAYRWRCSACSPPLQEHEAVVSNVIQISSPSNEAGEFNPEVKLVLSQSAPNLHGYEVVIKRLIDKDSNEWEEIDGSEDIRSLSDMEDYYPSPEDIPEFSFPVVQADITQCSTYAAVCRLKSSPSYTITFTGGTFSHPEYSGVSVTVPRKAVPAKVEIPLQLKVQEVPNEEFEDINVFVGPILRIVCSSGVEFSNSVTIQLPISLGDTPERIPDHSVCRVKVLFLKSEEGESKEWVEITKDLENPASFDGKLVTFKVKRFSGYTYFLHWRKDSFSVSGIVSCLSRYIWGQPREAAFFAYFKATERLQSQDILYLICCPAHLRKAVKQELEGEGITSSSDGNSKKMMIPGQDKAFVFVSGGISPVDKEDTDDFYLRLREDLQYEDTQDKDLQYRDQLKVRLINDQEYAKVQFRSSPEATGKNLLSKLEFKLPALNVDRKKKPNRRATSFQMEDILRVTLLATEWGSSKGGLSTLNRELAKGLAQQPNVSVTILLPKYNESEKEEAQKHKVNLATSEVIDGMDEISSLSFPSKDHQIDIVVGHGQKIGPPAQAIASQRNCKRVHIVHTNSEELAMFKKCPQAISEGEGKRQVEVKLCKTADMVLAIGPKLTETTLASLRLYSESGDVVRLTPGIFSEFSKLKQPSRELANFRVLVFGRGDPEDFQLKGYDIAAKAVAGLNDKSCRLIFVGAQDGKEEELKNSLIESGILPNQLTVRGYIESRQELSELFCEADLAIMPSRTEGFGLAALEALSAGLPILVSDNSGLGEALSDVPNGSMSVVDSNDVEKWGEAIRQAKQKLRKIRLKDASDLRENYRERYNWKEQCADIVMRMRSIK